MKSTTSQYHADPNKYSEFTTRRLNFASWLHAEGLLEFQRAEFNARAGKVEWHFLDGRQMGRDLEDQFDGGASASSAIRLFNSMHEMRRAMTDCQKSIQKPNGEFNHVQPESHRS